MTSFPGFPGVQGGDMQVLATAGQWFNNALVNQINLEAAIPPEFRYPGHSIVGQFHARGNGGAVGVYLNDTLVLAFGSPDDNASGLGDMLGFFTMTVINSSQANLSGTFKDTVVAGFQVKLTVDAFNALPVATFSLYPRTISVRCNMGVGFTTLTSGHIALVRPPRRSQSGSFPTPGLRTSL